MEPAPQRIGDAERDRAVELLRDHMAVGRLDQAEFDDRLGAALSARTASDLDPLFSDLPGPRPSQTLANMPSSFAPPAGAVAAPATAHRAGYNTALAIISAIIWPVTILAITFGFGWDNAWWLVFVPIIFSSALGKDHKDRRDRERERLERDQRRLDERRRALGD